MHTLPLVTNEEEHDKAVDQDVLWLDRTTRLARELELRGTVERFSSGSTPVLAVGDGFIIKWVPDFYAVEAEAEAVCLQATHGRLDVATPELVARVCRDTWQALVLTRVPGTSWHDLRESEQVQPWENLAFRTGRTLRQLHALAPPPCPRGVDWPAFVDERIREAAPVQKRRGLPDELVAALPDFLDAQGVGALAAQAPCLLHADLHRHHVLVDEGKVASWIDFADAFVGAPVYDLLAPATSLVRGNADVLQALLEGYGDPVLLTQSSEWWLAVTVLHRFAHLPRYAEHSDVPMDSLSGLAEALWPR